MVILDTDICVDLLRGNRSVIARRSEYPGPVGVSFMTAAELFYGAERSSDPDGNSTLVDQFLLSLSVLEPDLEMLRLFGSIKANLQSKGIPLADADIFIAATAVARSAQLVTGNIRHYHRIDGIALLDWR